MTTSAWDEVELLLAGVERPARYIDHEWGAVSNPGAEYRVVLVYPDTYEIGMANQALSILYARVNSQPGLVAERCFVPWTDMGRAMREGGVPLFGLESGAPVRDADLVGITLPCEATYTNVLEILDLSGIPLRADERETGMPLVVGGGPCVYNPEPVAPFFDALLIGEGEDAIVEIVESHRASRDAGASRMDALRSLSQVPGVYVPAFYEPTHDADGRFLGVEAREGVEPVVNKRAVADIDAHSPPACPVVPYMDVVHDRATIEVLRGCTRGCRFCQAGMTYRPVRERSADIIVRDALASLRCTGYDEVALTSLSTADHSQFEDVLRRLSRRLEGKGVNISVPSLRVDSFSVDMARLAAVGRKSGLTFAPEAGTQRLRDVINKNVTEQDLLDTVGRAFDAGWRRVKLYFMIGLPTETDEDIEGIGALVRRVQDAARRRDTSSGKSPLRVAVSVSVFVPKAQTPFQWDAQPSRTEIARRQGLLRSTMPRKGVDLSWHDPEVSYVEAVMARGGRELADAIEAAWRAGARFDAWTEEFELERWLEAFARARVDADAVACRERTRGEALPWDHVSSGVSKSYLWSERERGLAGQTTPDCSFSGCTGCDVCENIGIDTVLGGESRVHR